MTTLTSPDNIVIWTTSDPGSQVAESAAQGNSIQAALTARGGTVTTIAVLDAISTASIGGRAYMTSPGTGIEAVTWEAYAGTGSGLDWHIVDTVRASTKANLDNFVTAVAATSDLRFVVGGLAFVSATNLFYRFTSVTGAYRLAQDRYRMVPTSVTGTGVTFDTASGIVTCSAAPLITVDGVFTSDFSRYEIEIDWTLVSASIQPWIKLRGPVGAPVDISTAYTYELFQGSVATATASNSAANQSSFLLSGGGVVRGAGTVLLNGPAAARRTFLRSSFDAIAAVGTIVDASSKGEHDTATAYSGFTIDSTSAADFTGTVAITGIV